MELKCLISDLEQPTRDLVRGELRNLASLMDFTYQTFVISEKDVWKKLGKHELSGVSMALLRLDDPDMVKLGLQIYEASPFCRVIYYADGPRDLCPLLASRPIAFFDWKDGASGLRKLMRKHLEEIKRDQHFFHYEDRYHTLCVPYSGIAYFTSRDRVVYLQTPYGEQGPVRRTLDQVEQAVQDNGCFLRCHKSYLVRTDNCLQLNKSDKTLLLTNGEQIPVSRACWEATATLFVSKPQLQG